jgi:hypothetical protein
MRPVSHWIRNLLWLGLALCLAFGLGRPVYAQGAITVLADEHEHVFKESMTFHLRAESASTISGVRLFYRTAGQTSSNRVELEFEPGTAVDVEHVVDMADQENYLPPMVSIEYWWVIETADGGRLKTEPVSFVYDDTRYEWNVLESDLLRLYWHDQPAAFGQTYYRVAEDAAERLRDEFGVDPKDPVSIVIYNSHEELMSVLVDASAEWTGAVTFSGYGAIAIGLGPSDWMDRVIPHELTHAMLDQVTKPPFGDIPRWLDEGLAMRSEGGSTAEERAILADAIESNQLVSLRALNSTFADARDQAVLSYAESYSLIEFIVEQYGTDKLEQLIGVFAEGAHYDDAMLEVFGVDMDGMEDLWREYIGAPPRSGATRATPIPEVTAAATATSVSATATPIPAVPTPTQPLPTATAIVAAPMATPTEIAPTATPASASAVEPTAPPAGLSGAPCLGAAPAIAGLALWMLLRARAGG